VVSEAKPKQKPNWVKNTYFWLAAILLIIAIAGIVGGDSLIRDPGQKRENNLYLLYLGAAVVMAVNGFLSHRLTVKDFEEEQEG